MASESKKRKLENEEEKGLTFGTGIHRKLEIDEEFEKEIQQERGIKHLKTSAEKKLDKRLIVVLENANLELGLVRKSLYSHYVTHKVLRNDVMLVLRDADVTY